MIAKKCMLATVALGLAVLAGCPAEESRTNNQGGGSLITAGLDIATGNLGNLTADEIQVLVDRVDQERTVDIALTDEQATVIVDFIAANDLNTIADVQAIIDNPGGVQVPQSLADLIEADGLPDVN